MGAPRPAPLAGQRHAREQARPARLARLEREHPAQVARPLAHAHDPEAVGLRTG
jgi:hypothetical protein